MKIKLNGEYAKRHLFVAVLMIGLGCWFGYDGLVGYPNTSARDLFAQIEKAEPPDEMDAAKLEAFKAQKIQTQYGFMAIALLVGLVVGTRLYFASRFAFEFDDAGFTFDGKRFAYSDIKSVDNALWDSKRIFSIALANGGVVKLDAWHHTGVKEFHEKVAPAAAPVAPAAAPVAADQHEKVATATAPAKEQNEKLS